MLRWLFIFWLALLPLAGQAEGPILLPPLSAAVTDLTHTLSDADKAALETDLQAFIKDSGSQIVILMLPGTAPESIEQFGIRLAEAWKIGRQKIDDGVIVIVAKEERRMRIEVGYGLEGAIPDAIAKRIIDEHMAPAFRQGNFAGGLRSTVDMLQKRIRGEALPPPKAASPLNSEDSEGLLLFVIVLASLARALFGLIGSLAVAALAGALAWFAFHSVIAVAIASVLAFFASFMRFGRGGGQWRSGGGGFGGSPGSGGFSGGGGRFGGGGASGGW
ncbi:MAG: YgcG family protein [Azonexus sp.]|nr:YgcG family protein [Azonexus sp.]